MNKDLLSEVDRRVLADYGITASAAATTTASEWTASNLWRLLYRISCTHVKLYFCVRVWIICSRIVYSSFMKIWDAAVDTLHNHVQQHSCVRDNPWTAKHAKAKNECKRKSNKYLYKQKNAKITYLYSALSTGIVTSTNLLYNSAPVDIQGTQIMKEHKDIHVHHKAWLIPSFRINAHLSINAHTFWWFMGSCIA